MALLKLLPSANTGVIKNLDQVRLTFPPLLGGYLRVLVSSAALILRQCREKVRIFFASPAFSRSSVEGRTAVCGRQHICQIRRLQFVLFFLLCGCVGFRVELVTLKLKVFSRGCVDVHEVLDFSLRGV